MSWPFKSTGNSAEDAMGQAAGCFAIAVLAVVVCIVGAIVLLVRRMV